MNERTVVWMRGLVSAGAGIAILVLLPFVAFRHGHSLSLDPAVTNWLHGLQTPWLTQVMKWVSTYAYHNVHFWIIGAVGLFFLWYRRSLWEAVTLLAVRFGSDMLQEQLKAVFARPRPVLAWVKPSTSFSYPSGTVMVGAALCLALAYIIALHIRDRRAKIAVIASGWIAAGLIAVSRIYLGAHWLTDTVAAMAVAGATIAFLFIPIRLWYVIRPAGAFHRTQEALGEVAASRQE